MLSPDGKHVAITARVASGDRFVPIVVFYSLPDLKQVGALRLPIFEVPAGYYWVSNERLVIAKGKEPGSLEQPEYTGEIIATDLDGCKQEYLFGYNMFRGSKRSDRYPADEAWGTVEDLPRKRNGHFYLTSHDWEGRRSMLYDIDATTVIRKLMADVPSRRLKFVMQSNGSPRFAYGMGEDSYSAVYRYNDKGDSWEKYDDGKSRRYVPEAFMEDDVHFVSLHSRTGGPDEVIEESLRDGTRKVLFADKEASAGKFEYGAHSTPFAVWNTLGRPKVEYFNAGSEDAKLHQTLTAAFPGSTVHFINFTADGSILLFSVNSDRDPGSYYLYNRSTAKADLLFISKAAIEPEDMRSRTPVSFKARDGVTLHGFMTMPAHAAGTKVPLVLLTHGGPFDVADHWYFDSDAQFLASRGYAVLQVNFRGSGGRGVNFERAGHHQWGGLIQNDLADGMKWAMAQEDIDGKRMCTYGASFGGYASLMLAAREPDLVKCAVGYVGVYDLNRMIADDAAYGDKTVINYYKRTLGNDRAELAAFSPSKMADKIKAPVLLIQGGKDKIAPIEQGEIMRDALTTAGRPPEWLVAPNEGHGFYDTANRTKMYQQLAAFLDKHIGH